jgi:hypothetical protein
MNKIAIQTWSKFWIQHHAFGAPNVSELKVVNLYPFNDLFVCSNLSTLVVFLDYYYNNSWLVAYMWMFNLLSSILDWFDYKYIILFTCIGTLYSPCINAQQALLNLLFNLESSSSVNTMWYGLAYNDMLVIKIRVITDSHCEPIYTMM